MGCPETKEVGVGSQTALGEALGVRVLLGLAWTGPTQLTEVL